MLPSKSVQFARQSTRCRRAALQAFFAQPVQRRAFHYGLPRLYPRSDPKNEHTRPQTKGDLGLLDKLDMRNYETSIVPLTLDVPDRSLAPLPPIHRRADGTWGYDEESIQKKTISIHAMNIGGRISQYLHPSANGMTVDPLLVDAFGAWDVSELSEEEVTRYQELQEDYARQLTWNEEQEYFDEKPITFDNLPIDSQAAPVETSDDALDRIHKELDDMIGSLSNLLNLDGEDRKALESKDPADPEEFDRLFQERQKRRSQKDIPYEMSPKDVPPADLQEESPRVLETVSEATVKPVADVRDTPSSSYHVDHDRIEYTPPSQSSPASSDTFEMDTSSYTRGEEIKKTLSELKQTMGERPQVSQEPSSSASEQEDILASLPPNIPGIDVVTLGQIQALISDGMLVAYVGPAEDEMKPVWTRMVDPLLVDTFGVWDENDLTEEQLSDYRALWKNPESRRMTRVEQNPETGEYARVGHVTFASGAGQAQKDSLKSEEKSKTSSPAGLGDIYDKLKSTFKKP